MKSPFSRALAVASLTERYDHLSGLGHSTAIPVAFSPPYSRSPFRATVASGGWQSDGLSPGIGGRSPSLALDLQEEFRPLFCDAFVTRLINRGTITHDQFGNDNRLTDDGFQAYLDKFDGYMDEELTHPHFEYRVSRRKAIRQQVILLRKAITGELDDYHALEVSR